MTDKFSMTTDELKKIYVPPMPEPPDDARDGKITTWADMAAELGPIEWAWKPYIPMGLLTEIVAAQGVGKSGFMLTLLNCLISGGTWPDGTPVAGELGCGLWVECESSQAVNLDRARAWGVPANRIYNPFYNGLEDVNLDLPVHRSIVTEKAMLPEVKMIIVDTLAGSSRTSEKDMKDIPQFLAHLARDAKKPVIASHHLRKKGEIDTTEITLDRVRGSSQITQFARSVIALDIPNPYTMNVVRVQQIKNNLARFAPPLGFIVTDTGLRWCEAPTVPQAPSKLDDARDFLKDLLQAGPMRQADIKENAEGAGHSWHTIQRAMTALKIVTRKETGKNGAWTWALPAIVQSYDPVSQDD